MREHLLDMYDRMPDQGAEDRRHFELALRRPYLNAEETIELEEFIAADPSRKKTDRAIAKRQKKHPGESRADALLAIYLAKGEKQQARDDAEDEAELAAEAAEKAERFARTPPMPAEPFRPDLGDLPPAKPKRRLKVGITTIPFA